MKILKQISLLLVILGLGYISSPLMAQSINIGSGNWNNCGPGTFYDTGGAGGNYSSSESITETHCSTAGNCIQFVFTAFNTEAGFDDLTIYDGPNIGSPLIGVFDGTALPNGGTITSTSGCLTFVWSSDGSITRSGWAASVSCVPCPAPTCSDGIQNQGETGVDCGGPCPACSLNHNIGTGNFTSCTGNLYDTGGSASNYSNSQNITETYCSDAGDCISLNFSAFNLESCCDDLTIYDGPNISSPLIGVYTGTTLPNGGTITSSTGCLTFVFSSDGSVTRAGWEAAISCGVCPATPTCTDGILNGQEIGIDCGGPTCPACPCSSLPITNDEACCATPLTVNASGLCNTVTSGTVVNATGSPQSTAACFGTEDDDVWFSFVATDTIHTIDLLNAAGSTTDLYHSVWTGACSSLSLVAGSCSDPNSSSLTSLIPGQTYYIRVYTYTSTTGQTTTFDICVATPPPPPPNVTCAQMEPICSDSPISFTAASGGADASVIDPGNNYGCLSTSPNPTWFYLEIDTAGVLAVDMTANSDIDFALWGPYPSLATAQATCGSLPLPIDCSYSTSPTEQANAPTAVVGQVYMLLVTNYADVTQSITLNSAATNTATTNCAIVLPIELLSFTAKNINSKNVLSWITTSEINNDYFQVEASSNMIQFFELGKVGGAGNSNVSLNYNFTDQNPLADLMYYRLKQVDFDGDFEYSNIIAVRNKTNLNVSIYPNPSKENLFFEVNVSNDETYTITYTSIIGSVHEELVKITNGTNKYQVKDFITLPSGIYFIQILNENNEIIKRQKIVKQ